MFETGTALVSEGRRVMRAVASVMLLLVSWRGCALHQEKEHYPARR